MDLSLFPFNNWTSSSSLNDSGENPVFLQVGEGRSEAESFTSEDDRLYPSSSSCPFTSSPSSDSSCSSTVIELLIKYSIGSLLIFIIFMSISGNILVCVAIYTDRRLRKLGNLFLASLALADLFLASLVMTFAVANDLLGYWPFGESFCEIWIASDVMCCTSSIINLCAISLDRFIHIKDPLRYENWMTKKVILSSVTAIWLVSALVSFLPISLGWHRPDSISILGSNGQHMVGNYTELIGVRSINGGSSDQGYASYESTGILSYSSEEFIPNGSDLTQTMVITVPGEDGEGVVDGEEPAQCSMDLTPTYAVVSSAISFYIPCLIMIALYTRLYLYAKKHVQNIKSMSKPLNHQYLQAGTTDHESRSSGSIDHSAHPKEKHSHVTEHKAAITLGIIMGVFLFCWVPFFIVNIIGAFCKSCIPGLLFKVLTWLGYFNSAMNPVIYSIFNTEFREAFRKILTSYVRNECCNRNNINFTHDQRMNHGRSNPTAISASTRPMIKRSLELSPGNDGNFNDKTGSRNGQGGNTGGGQRVPGVITAGNLRSSGREITPGGKSREGERSKVRKPLLSFSKKKKKEEKTNESTVEPCDGIREQSNSGGAGRSCSLDTFPSTTGCPTPSTANKKMMVGGSSLLTYSHVDIHTSDEHGKISAI